MLPALKLNKYPRQQVESIAMDKLRQMHMEDYATKLSSKLSGGQQQRVAIARALVNDPNIIMADEPTGNLDSTNARNVFDILHQLAHEQGNSIVMVTHDPDFARLADRSIELVDGRIIKQ